MLFNSGTSKFWALVHTDNPSRFLTVVDKKELAKEYCFLFIKAQHFEHYSLWLNCRDWQDSDEHWQQYFDNCIDKEEKEKYVIQEIRYKRKDLAAILRMFCGCVPLGNSFDTPAEENYFMYKLKCAGIDLTKSKEEILNDIDKQEKELKDGTK